MPTKKTFKSVNDYIQSQPEQTRPALTQLREIIREAAPGAEELFNYDIPAFALVKGGKRDQQIMMAGYARHVGFYPHPRTIEHFSDGLADYKFAKGSVQFPLTSPLPKALIVKMVKWRLKDLGASSEQAAE